MQATKLHGAITWCYYYMVLLGFSYVCMYMYVYIYSSDMDIYKNYTVIMKIIIYSVEISSPIGTISNSEVVNLQL